MNMYSPGSRRAGGNVLPLIIAVLGFFVFAIACWTLSTMRLIGSHQEQMTAIEAAALAAVRDVGSVVIEDPNFGFIGVSDRAPTGTRTIAGDKYYLSVTGINTLLATIRLDMIVAEQMNNDVMRQLALRDYNNAMIAKDSLTKAVQSAIVSGGTAKDLNNNPIDAYGDAVAAYKNNVVRMNGGDGQLVAGSMKLTLGLNNSLDSTTPIPLTSSMGAPTPSQQDQGLYRAFVDIPFNGHSFVLSAGSTDASLVDSKSFSASLGSLPYAVFDVIKCEADERMMYKGQDGKDAVAIVHAKACAEPGVMVDPTPAAGALEFCFSDGMFPEVAKPGDVFLFNGLLYSPVDRTQQPTAGDFPPAALIDYTPPAIGDDHAPAGKLLAMAFYDWLRRGRAHVNVNALMTALNTKFNGTIPANLPQKHRFQVQPDGSVSYAVVPDTPTIALAVSQNQYRAESGMIVFSTNGKTYDLFLRDFCCQLGRTAGGMHAGEPIDINGPLVTGGGTTQPLDEHQLSTSMFNTGPAGGAVRPTYQKMGVAVQVRFKAR